MLASGTFGGLVVSMLASGTFGGLVVSMPASGTFGGLVVSIPASGTFGGLVVSMLASGTFGGLVVSILASGTPSSRIQIRPKPSNFSGRKIHSMPSFGGEVKPSVPCRSFAECKKIPYDFRGSRDRKAKFVRPFLAHNSTFH
jgi:hypothetical protein